MDTAGNPFQALTFNLIGIHITFTVQTKKYWLHTIVLTDRNKFIIVTIQNDMSIRLHRLEYLCLCFQDSVSVSQILQMTGSDVCDHAGVRFCNLCQPGHLAKITDSHFQNCNLIFITKSEYCKRKSELIIKVSLCFQSAVLFFQDGCDHFFGAGLSNASRNTYNRNLQLFQIKLCDIFNCLKRSIYLNICIVSLRQFSLGKCCKRSLRHHIRNKTVCIDSLSHDWHKQTVFLNLTAVCSNCRNLLIQQSIVAMPDAITYFCKISQSKIFHSDFLS